MQHVLPRYPDFAARNAELVVAWNWAIDRIDIVSSTVHKRVLRDVVRLAAHPNAVPALVVMAPDGDAVRCRRRGEVDRAPTPLAAADWLAAGSGRMRATPGPTLRGRLADLPHGRRLMQADLSETEQRVADLATLRRVAPAVLDAPPRAEAAVAPLTALNTLVRIHVESAGLDDAGTRRRLCEQPYHRYRFDARREAEDSGLPGSTRSSGRA